MDPNINLLKQQLQKSLLAIRKLKEDNARLSNGNAEAIAIVGMGFKLPIDEDSPAKLWETLTNGKDNISKIPETRWKQEKFFDPNPEVKNKYYVNEGGVLKRNLKEFDPGFFNISPPEAKYMDPQQRLLLEACWEALENANISPDSLQNSETGVFVGISSFDNAIRLHTINAPISAYNGTGNTLSGGAGRIAHTFGFCGPVINIDTACSSSLVALHQACKSIHRKECSVALVGGVNILLSPEVMVNFCQSRMLAVDGRCKTFDESANGYSRGEGVGMIVLKPLSKALKDDDTILAVIKGSAVNHDGKSAGLTVPNGLAQQAVLRKALKDADLNPEDIGYVECHGTGTSLGDPIEFEAIANVYGNRSVGNPLYIGSLKTNIGHLEAAAGIAGLIKVVLCLQHKKIAAHLHFNNPSKHISWDKFPQIQIPTKTIDWKPTEEDALLRAGISSFGFTGTNAHVVVEEYKKAEIKVTSHEEQNPFPILTISAKSKEALFSLQKRYVEFLQKNAGSAQDICYSSNLGRSHFKYRFSVAAENLEQMKVQLQKKTLTDAHQVRSPKIAFLFTGQGSQYINMGKELYQVSSFFRERIIECDELLSRAHFDISLVDLLFNKEQEQNLNQTKYAQPALFSIEYALASLWIHWGIEPEVLLGHSIGELVAACIANVFSLEDALRLVIIRGKLMQNAPGNGVMYQTQLSREELFDYLEHAEKVSIAAVNGPKQSVLSGDKGQVEKIVYQIKEKGHAVAQLNVSHAFHSPLMESVKKEFANILRQVRFKPPTRDIISNLNGSILQGEMATPEYWAEQIVRPVNFYDCAKTLEKLSIDSCIEVGPNPVLLSFIGRSVSNSPKLLPSLRSTESAWVCISRSIASLYEAGIDFNWDTINHDFRTNKILLPNYPFQFDEYWVDGQKKVKEGLAGIHDAPIVEQITMRKEKQLSENTTDKSDLDNLLYKLDWIEQELPDPGLSTVKNWLLIEYDKGVSDIFQNTLTDKNEQSKTIYLGGFNHDNLEEYIQQKLVDASFDQEPFHLVVFTPAKVVNTPNDLFTKGSDYGFSLLYLIQMFERKQRHSSIKSLSLVHLSEEPTSSNSAHTFASLVAKSFMALGRVVENELKTISLKCITIESFAQAKDYILIYHEIISAKKESGILLSRQKREVLRLRLLSPDTLAEVPDTEPIFSPDKSYLITGGLGALGLQIAEWAAENKAKNLFLLSRTGNMKKEAEVLFAELENKSINVHVVKADVGNELEMKHVYSQFGDKYPALGGIFHLAGTLSDASIFQQKKDQFQEVLKPKLNGAWNLHQLSKKEGIEFFVQFSSLSSVLGTPGQANYAYANAFLDALAAFRVEKGLPCLNINWGPWEGAGMAENLRPGIIDNVIGKMPAFQGIHILNILLRSKYNGTLSVGKFNIPLLQSLNMPLFAETTEHQSKSGLLNSQKNNAPEVKDKNAFDVQIGDLKRILSAILELPIEQLDKDVPIINYGFDSLLALQTTNKIYKYFGIELDMAVFMTNPSIEKLKDILLENYQNQDTTKEKKEKIKAEEVENAAEKLKNIDQLSEAEIDRLLKSLT